MKIKFYNLEKTEEKSFLIINNKSIKTIKKNYKKEYQIVIDFDYLNLGQKLYGSTKKETKKIQKANSIYVVKIYRKICSLVRKIRKLNFDGIFYVTKKDEKKNNNDLMIERMVNLHFEKNIFSKMRKSIIIACDFLDAENKINNMCDFKDNKCAKHRFYNFDRPTLCCPSKCKFNCPCKTKNLACKLYMCEFLVKQGYCFNPQYIPVLRVHMTFLERYATWGVFFRSTKRTVFFMWVVRFLLSFWTIGIGLLFVINLFRFI